MAGHSQFSNIKHRKEAQDAKRAKKFTKLRREIIVAARAGLPNPELNPRLRAAIVTARREGLPKDKIDNAIKSSAGNQNNDHYQEVRYEGYGSGGTAIIIESLTDNRNRTAAELRFIFSRNGGSLAEVGSVNYLFDHIGLISYAKLNNEEIFDTAIEQNAIDIESTDELYHIQCTMTDFASIRDTLYKQYGTPHNARLIWSPKEKLHPSNEEKEKLIKLLAELEDNDDVQHVYCNV